MTERYKNSELIDFNNDYDMVIVGGGTIGVSAAYYATRAGLRTVIIDKADIPSSAGSSKGYERIFRIMYAQDNRIRLTEASYALWKEIEEESGQTLLIKDDLLFFGHKNAPDTPEGNLQDMIAAMNRQGVPYEALNSPQEIQNKYPVFNAAGMPSDYIGLVQRNSATINVQNSLNTFLNLAMDSGLLTIAAYSQVTNLGTIPAMAGNDGFNVTIAPAPGSFGLRFGQAGTIKTKYLILAPGVWAGNLLSSLTNGQLQQNDKYRIWQMSLAFWKQNNPTQDKIPLWYEFGNTEQNQRGLFYGFPDVGLSNETKGRVKIAADYTDTMFTDPSQITGTPDPTIINEIKTHISGLFRPGVLDVNDYASQNACLYSMPSDGKVVIGGIPTRPMGARAFNNGAMSVMEAGRAFKYTPLFGRILVNIATNPDMQTGPSGFEPNSWGSGYDGDIAEFTPWRSGLWQGWG